METFNADAQNNRGRVMNKVDLIARYFKKIMEELGMDLTDDSLKDTPLRVAKMYTNELFSGMNRETFPKISTFNNTYNYDQMLIETNIEINSVCEHHFVPILGKCHIAYIPNKKVIGLSKLNRIAKYYAARPQVQERLTSHILKELKAILNTDHVAVVIDAVHLCVKMRGVKDSNSETRTIMLDGYFKNNESTRNEFINCIPRMK